MNFCAGDHSIRIVDAIGNENTVVVTFEEPDPIEIEVIEITCSNEDDGSIDLSVSGGTGEYEYDWGISGADASFVENLAAGDYSLLVNDENNCQALIADLLVETCETGECFVANPVITPNNDGINDAFVINCLREYANNQLDVYDRWGRKVFAESNYAGNWQGTGTEGELDEGSYMWVLTVYLGNGDERIYKGTLTLLR
jgi:gliding motility-associated-like protein